MPVPGGKMFVCGQITNGVPIETSIDEINDGWRGMLHVTMIAPILT